MPSPRAPGCSASSAWRCASTPSFWRPGSTPSSCAESWKTSASEMWRCAVLRPTCQTSVTPSVGGLGSGSAIFSVQGGSSVERLVRAVVGVDGHRASAFEMNRVAIGRWAVVVRSRPGSGQSPNAPVKPTRDLGGVQRGWPSRGTAARAAVVRMAMTAPTEQHAAMMAEAPPAHLAPCRAAHHVGIDDVGVELLVDQEVDDRRCRSSGSPRSRSATDTIASRTRPAG